MGSGSSKTRRFEGSSSSSVSSASSFSSSVGERRRCKNRGVFNSACLGSSSKCYDSEEEEEDDDDQVSNHHGETSRTQLQRSEPESDKVKVACYRGSKVDGPDNLPCVSPHIELGEWSNSNGACSGIRSDGSSSQASSGQSLNNSSRFLSRFNFVPGSVSFRLGRVASVGSSRAYPSSPTSFTIQSGEEDLHLRRGFPPHFINSNETRHNTSVNSSCLTSASVRSHGDSSVNFQHPANSTLSSSLQDDQAISSQDLWDHDSERTSSDACLPSLRSQMNMEGVNRRFGNRQYGAREPVDRNVHFSRTLSVGRLRDRVLRRPSYSDLTLAPLQQERTAASNENSVNSLMASHPLSSMPNPYHESQNNDVETSQLREGRHHEFLEHRSNFLERRRRIRSQVRALQRLGSRFENLSGHERYCVLSGQHRSGRCSCRISSRDANSNHDGAARASISRIVMLAEALFEVLDEIHQQSMVLSSRPSVSSIGSVPAPTEVVESLPVKSYIKSTKFLNEEVAQCYICLLEYEEGEDMRILPCHHEFHKKCIDKWLKEIHRVCPLCRGDICRSDSLSAGSGGGC